MRALLSPPCSLLPRPPQPWQPPNLSSRFHVSWATKYRPWDSNAETFRSEKFNSGFRGTEVENEEEEEEEEEDEDEVEDFGLGFRSRGKKRRRWWSDEGSSSSAIDDTPFGIFNEVIDSIWILKVFKSYGWALPPIIVSLLVTTGPKAFLMALALPLGQSVISLAFEKLWGRTESRQKQKPRTRKRPFSSARPSKEAGRKEEGEKREEVGKRKMGYQSWEDSNNDYVNKNSRNDSDFGGWDDLDRARSSRKSPGARGRNTKTVTEEDGKLSRNGRKSETPLLLRLLIAVFPFLGSWTKIL